MSSANFKNCLGFECYRTCLSREGFYFNAADVPLELNSDIIAFVGIALIKGKDFNSKHQEFVFIDSRRISE